MTEDQVVHLRSQVAGHKPSIPYYVCRMTKSNVIPGKAKMVNNGLFLLFLCTSILVSN